MYQMSREDLFCVKNCKRNIFSFNILFKWNGWLSTVLVLKHVNDFFNQYTQNAILAFSEDLNIMLIVS